MSYQRKLITNHFKWKASKIIKLLHLFPKTIPNAFQNSQKFCHETPHNYASLTTSASISTLTQVIWSSQVETTTR